jgi:F0F1-type ATP synthase membrane subunit a
MCFLLNPIEWLSGWVRPLSMSARISINLICGHLLVGLCLGMFIQINSMLIVNSLFISISNFYIALVETFIPLIQTFILFTLYTQWVLEIK